VVFGEKRERCGVAACRQPRRARKREGGENRLWGMEEFFEAGGDAVGVFELAFPDGEDFPA